MEFDLHQLLKLPFLLPGKHKGEQKKKWGSKKEAERRKLIIKYCNKEIDQGSVPCEMESNDESPADPCAVRVRWSLEPPQARILTPTELQLCS